MVIAGDSTSARLTATLVGRTRVTLRPGVTDLREAALEYAGRGWLVLPLVPRDKVPLVRYGLKDASADRIQVEQWWHRWPAANIGIVTGPASGLLVVGLDGDEG
jgi:hypothetical protein